MIFPITGSIIESNFPLQGIANEISFGFPEWFNYSVTGTLHNLLSIYCKEAEKFQVFTSNSYIGSIPGEGNLHEPRQAHVISYVDGPYTTNSKAIRQCNNYADFLLDYTPVYYVNDDLLLFRNLNTEISVFPSVTGAVDDRLYYYSNTIKPSIYYRPFEVVPSAATGIYLSPTPSNSVEITYANGILTGSVVSLRNSWDKQALFTGLYRYSLEDNISLANRIKSRLLKSEIKTRSATNKNIATEIGTVNTFSVNTSTSTSYSGNIYSPIPQYNWARELLFPEIYNGIQYSSISKRSPKYLRLDQYSTSSVTGAVVAIQRPSEASYIYTNWTTSGSVVSVSSDYPDSISFVSYSGVYISSLDSIKSRLFSGVRLTSLGLEVYGHFWKSQSVYNVKTWKSFKQNTALIEVDFPVIFQD